MQIIGIISAALGAYLFFRGRMISRDAHISEAVKKTLYPDTEIPFDIKAKKFASGAMIFIGGVLTSMGGFLIVG